MSVFYLFVYDEQFMKCVTAIHLQCQLNYLTFFSYHKFTRGKDVSRYNSDDIACIIGSKRSKQLADIEATQIKEEDEVGQQVKLNGVTTVKGGTVQVS